MLIIVTTKFLGARTLMVTPILLASGSGLENCNSELFLSTMHAGENEGVINIIPKICKTGGGTTW